MKTNKALMPKQKLKMNLFEKERIERIERIVILPTSGTSTVTKEMEKAIKTFLNEK